METTQMFFHNKIDKEDIHIHKSRHTYIHTMEYSSATKKEIMPFAKTWMNPEIIILSEVSPKEKGINTGYHLYVKSKKIPKLICKTEINLKT